MELSGHAKNKLEVYRVDGPEIIEECKNPILELYDTDEDSHIKIIELRKILFVVVFNEKSQIVITVYRTDSNTIKTGKKAKDGYSAKI